MERLLHPEVLGKEDVGLWGNQHRQLIPWQVFSQPPKAVQPRQLLSQGTNHISSLSPIWWMRLKVEWRISLERPLYGETGFCWFYSERCPRPWNSVGAQYAYNKCLLSEWGNKRF